jgi:hypothetical protein
METFGQNGIILGSQVVDAADVASRDDEQVHGGVGVDVAENDEVFVFIQKRGLGLAGGDVTEQTIRGHVGCSLLDLLTWMGRQRLKRNYSGYALYPGHAQLSALIASSACKNYRNKQDCQAEQLDSDNSR